MFEYRKLTDVETCLLKAGGNISSDWTKIEVAEDFCVEQIVASYLEGVVRIGCGTRIIRSKIANYILGCNTVIEQVTALECRHQSSFGNGVKVSAMNECGGRAVKIYDTISAQCAYIMAVYRHRQQTIEAMELMIEYYTRERTSALGYVGDNSRIFGAKFIREVHIGNNVVIDGCSILENGTICDGAHMGVDVKAYDFIAAEGARVDNAAIVERCFVGESCIVSNGFTAVDSLFFANSHFENGEAAAIFAGPYTVSHHKSTLLIAGMFSFFNAGSGSNQSNHLFKSGAVHQSVHLRGCKFASSAYIMSPALEAPFTMVLGHHSFHHDTSAFPYSYLVEKDERSMLMPAANLTSYGAVRDIEKWPARDKRTVRRDVVNFEEHNPYITDGFIKAVNTLNAIADEDPDAAQYNYKKVTIKAHNLQRGLELYSKAIVASLGWMLGKGVKNTKNGHGRWLDISGQYITKNAVGETLDAIDRGELSTTQSIDNRFRMFSIHYDDYAYNWAENMLANILGHNPSEQEIADAVLSGKRVRSEMRRMTDRDRARDCSMDMSISYGLDSEGDISEIIKDYNTVRGLK